jgi:cysteine desulfurase/selenocysteine lyase
MIDRVFADHSTWAPVPARFEAGTLAIAQAIALRQGIEFVQSVGFDAMHQYEFRLLTTLHQRLASVPGLRIHGPAPEHKGAIVSFTMDKAHPEDLAHLLDRKGVFVRHGHHCAMLLHEWLQVPATVRVSLAVYNNLRDIENLIDALMFARERLRLD